MSKTFRLVLISDTHNHHDRVNIPDGDILLHGGDFTNRGRVREVISFNRWLGQLPHKHKVIIAGNHDFLFERRPSEAQGFITNAIYLQDEVVIIGGLHIYGSPWQPWFHDWAFNLQRGEPLRRKWLMIPDKTDILITHGPPHGICDKVDRGMGQLGIFEHVGCKELLKAVERVNPCVHLFGHIHEDYGSYKAGDEDPFSTYFVNGSICTLRHEPIRDPVVVDVEQGDDGKWSVV